VLRRREPRRFCSATDDEVGGFHARLHEQRTIKEVRHAGDPR
jgi:hypothetical protein